MLTSKVICCMNLVGGSPSILTTVHQDENRFYGLVAVDYAQELVHMGAYQPDDQARIRQLMHTVSPANN